MIFGIVASLTTYPILERLNLSWLGVIATGLMLITAPYPLGLCFASAYMVRLKPKLARLGMYTLALLVISLGLIGFATSVYNK